LNVLKRGAAGDRAMNRRRFILFLAVLLVLLAPAVIAGLHYGLFYARPVGPSAPVSVTIPTGSSFAEIARRLADEGVVADADYLRVLARLRGDARKIKAGEYEFFEPAVPGAVLDRLVAGDVRRYRLTIPEGLSLREIALRFEAEGIGEALEFLKLTTDPEFVGTLGITASTLEGYLFPETYTYVAGTPRERLIEAMVRQFNSRLSADLQDRARSLGLDNHQLVTLASIIQKEAGNREEMPIISGVFHNRLRLGMPLQADPTVIYGIEDFDGRITYKHLRTHTPYNTYRIRGLPPGPIASPGEDALRAAAYPAEVDYLYFVSRGDGTHVFSRTLKEHNAAVRKYILRRPGP
jgi:UPF0755 protein